MHYKKNSVVLASALGVLTVVAAVGNAQGGLAAHGPLNDFGFPSYYEDHAGLRLDQCIDQDDPLCGIPVADFLAGAPDVAAGNFFGESFYWLAVSTMNIPDRGDALLVLAVEAVWGNPTEAVQDGDQTVFSRLRIRLNGDGFEAGLYSIETPYGRFEFEAPAVTAGRIINFTSDCLHVIQPAPGPQFLCGSLPDGPDANYFSTPLGFLDDGTSAPEVAPNGPDFLTWDPTIAPQAPTGYIGDPAVPHPVVGATPGNSNHFRVLGPGFDQTTDLFSVMGRKAEFTLDVSPGTAGVANTLTATGSSGRGAVAFFVGTDLGVTNLPLPSCPGLALGTTGNLFIGFNLANNVGRAQLTATPPADIVGLTFHLQALDLRGCATSNVRSVTF
ncbi:MAG: hypothetical protein CMJ89_05875 [Planctomycetes bacterium]|jgi:hypothetical protein|nr:hypothetical protein [Planctomycetota bacterium]